MKGTACQTSSISSFKGTGLNCFSRSGSFGSLVWGSAAPQTASRRRYSSTFIREPQETGSQNSWLCFLKVCRRRLEDYGERDFIVCVQFLHVGSSVATIIIRLSFSPSQHERLSVFEILRLEKDKSFRMTSLYITDQLNIN